ncbi:MAG: hypothetical protein HGA45_08695 [Chloroflexales bacterium]|nr:hypothetical protein [Chloroflexales bacterium]
MRGVQLHAGTQRIARLHTGWIASHYAFILLLEQSETERILLGRLHELGVVVERPVTLTALEATPAGAVAHLHHADGALEPLAVPWVVGCDGAHSTVRHALGLPFAGQRYGEAFALADVELEGVFPGMADQLNLFLSPAGLAFLAPLAGGRHRIILDEPPGSADEDRPPPTADELQRRWRAHVAVPGARDLTIAHTHWSSRFTIHRRIVPALRHTRVLLAGDAAHVHSPAGAQGMNGGIQDAVNLGWKLALVVRGQATEPLLDSYDAERLPVERAILRATDLVTRGATLRHPVAQWLRAGMLRQALATPLAQRLLPNLLAGIAISYRGSPLAVDEERRRPGAPGVAAGDRAPDVTLRSPGPRRLYDRLNHPGFTLLIFAGVHPTVEDLTRAGWIAREVAARATGIIKSVVVAGDSSGGRTASGWDTALSDLGGVVHVRYGVRQGLCLIRPDRAIGIVVPRLDVAPLWVYLESCLHMGLSAGWAEKEHSA